MRKRNLPAEKIHPLRQFGNRMKEEIEMKLEEMSKELIEEAKACRTLEELNGFLSAHQIELTAEQMEAISGGSGHAGEVSDPHGTSYCTASKGSHDWIFTGRTRPGTVWGDLWPDYEHICRYCGEINWRWTTF